MSLIDFFRPQPRKLQLIRRISSRMRLHEWRGERDFVRAAQKFLGDPNFLLILDVLRNESPGNWVMDAARATLEERAIIQARNEGYQMALTNIESLGTYDRPKQPLEPDFPQTDE